MKVEEIVDWAKYAENSGFGYIFRSDHLLPTSGRSLPQGSPECWVTLGTIAASTTRINFGPMVSPIGFRNPALLAKMALTLHSYSCGRLILSIGAGWYRSEYEALGIPFPGLKERKEQFHEALQIIRPLTEGKRVTFKGKYFSADLEGLPKPEPSKIHLVIGGKDTQIVRLAASFADELNLVYGSSEVIEKYVKIVENESAGKSGRIPISQMGPFFIGETQTKLESNITRYLRAMGSDSSPRDRIKIFMERGIFCGTTEEFKSQLEAREKLGVSKFYFQILDPTNREMVETLVEALRY